MTEDGHYMSKRTVPPHPEVRTSDGLVAKFPTPEMLEERARKHAGWLSQVTPPRPAGHEFVWTRSQPLNWSPVEKPLAQSTVALVSTGGVHLRSQKPYDVYAEEGDWSSREIPGGVSSDRLTVTHTHYAISDALQDINVMFPLDRLRELAARDVIGAVSPLHTGFMGFIPDPRLLVTESAPAVGAVLKRRGVDVVVLTGS